MHPNFSPIQIGLFEILLKISFDILLSNIISKLIILELLCKRDIKNLLAKLLKKQKLLWFQIYI